MSDSPTRIRVRSAAPYDVVIGSGLGAELLDALPGDARQAAVIYPRTLRDTAAALGEQLSGRGVRPALIEVPDGEDAKTAEVANRCWAELGALGFTRSDAVVGVGGGSTTDLAGFVAATWLRGVPVVHLPTTLLGMVDAAVGGKTGVNTAAGKNLVGAIHEPHGVVCDLDHLTSLPTAELVSGLAEVVKCGFIADPAILDLVEADPAAAMSPGGSALRELVERAVQVKAEAVAADLRESMVTNGPIGREALNYGHTLAHAIERVEGYRFRHGEAVAIGLVFAAELAKLAGRLEPVVADRHSRVLRLVGLPTSYRRGRWSELSTAMRADKKARGERLRFVVLDALAQPAILTAPDPGLLLAAYSAVEASA